MKCVTMTGVVCVAIACAGMVVADGMPRRESPAAQNKGGPRILAGAIGTRPAQRSISGRCVSQTDPRGEGRWGHGGAGSASLPHGTWQHLSPSVVTPKRG